MREGSGGGRHGQPDDVPLEDVDEVEPVIAVDVADPRRRGIEALELSRQHRDLAGATVVHCPGAHLYFGRPPFPWRRWCRAGVPIALGTDSLARNREVDMLREMALLRESLGVGPKEAWQAATVLA